MKCLGKPGGGGDLDTSQSEMSLEEIFVEPLLVPLAGKKAHEHGNLISADGFREGNEKIGCSQIPIILGDLVFEYQMVPEGVPRQLIHYAVVLMKIMSVVSEDKIRGKILLQLLKAFLHIGSGVRKKSITKGLDHYRFLSRLFEKCVGTGFGLIRSLWGRGEDKPVDLNQVGILGQFENRAPATDLYIVAVSSYAQDA